MLNCNLKKNKFYFSIFRIEFLQIIILKLYKFIKMTIQLDYKLFKYNNYTNHVKNMVILVFKEKITI